MIACLFAIAQDSAQESHAGDQTEQAGSQCGSAGNLIQQRRRAFNGDKCRAQMTGQSQRHGQKHPAA